MTLRCGRGQADDTGLTVTVLESRAGLCLRGEADVLGAYALRAAIAALPADAGEVHLELAGLRFIDVCSTRELIALARRPARPRLILHQPPHTLTLLISLLWPDCRQIPAPSNSRTGDSATVSIQGLADSETKEMPVPRSSRYTLPLAGELPDTLKRSPQESREAFTRALATAVQTHGEGDQAVRAAYAEFKQEFEKRGDHWIPKQAPSPEA
jgi:hypothetical protein